MKQPIDTLIEARWVIPVAPRGVVHEYCAVAVDVGRIVGVLPTTQANEQFAPIERVVLPQSVLIPGLINAHTHAPMTLMRGIADDIALMRWLHEHIWPAEARHVSPDYVYDGTLVACAEMLRGGITCANDMYFFPDASARAFLDGGMRAALGIIAFEFPSTYGSGPDDYLAKGLAVRDQYGDEPLLSFCLAPHAPYTVSDKTFQRIVTIAEELDLPIHCHIHETHDEIEKSLVQHRTRPLARLNALGMVSPHLIAVHAVHLTQQEIELLAENGVTVAHCPSSNLKLASGLAPIASLMAAGVNVALGTDGAASNNRLDMLQEMRTAALLAKGVSGNAEAMPAESALYCATMAGAKALGIDHLTGSIEPGKAADLCAVSMADPIVLPCFDPIAHLVYVAGREQVERVWVAGRSVVRDGRLVNPMLAGLEKRTNLWHNKLRS
ncbi:MAG: TRZ/ATZ family hydrolase [Betaproteobacteria bacterium]|nr:TRZ/ATZ family hydrolase [Betaproteobacteria bacterium]